MLTPGRDVKTRSRNPPGKRWMWASIRSWTTAVPRRFGLAGPAHPRERLALRGFEMIPHRPRRAGRVAAAQRLDDPLVLAQVSEQQRDHGRRAGVARVAAGKGRAEVAREDRAEQAQVREVPP